MHRRNVIMSLVGAAWVLGCGETPTATEQEIASREIDRLVIFVRDWPDRYVEIALTRDAESSTFIIYRPPQPGVPRQLIDSIGPEVRDPPEIADLLARFDVWALADSNAAGAACSTKYGFWRCEPTIEDYSVVIGVTRDGDKRAQRYTGLDDTNSTTIARALGDFVFQMAHRREAAAHRQ